MKYCFSILSNMSALEMQCKAIKIEAFTKLLNISEANES